MAREIRTGRNFCDSPGMTCSRDELTFINIYGKKITYHKNSDFIERVINAGSIDEAIEVITGDAVLIKYLNFWLEGGKNAGDPNKRGHPALIIITIGASPKEQGVTEGIVRLETTVSSRQNDE